MVQDVQVMGYMPSMPGSVAAPRRIERERSDSSYFFHDVILGMLMILFPVDAAGLPEWDQYSGGIQNAAYPQRGHDDGEGECGG